VMVGSTVSVTVVISVAVAVPVVVVTVPTVVEKKALAKSVMKQRTSSSQRFGWGIKIDVSQDDAIRTIQSDVVIV